MLRRTLLLVSFALPALMVLAGEPEGRSVNADLDMNGHPDAVQLRVSGNAALLSVKMNSKQLPVISIPRDGSKQFGICAESRPAMRLVPQSEAPLHALGEWPRGYTACPKCVEIEVSGGGCDPIHFYWNSIEGKLDWWRE